MAAVPGGARRIQARPACQPAHAGAVGGHPQGQGLQGPPGLVGVPGAEPGPDEDGVAHLLAQGTPVLPCTVELLQVQSGQRRRRERLPARHGLRG
eukprot:1899587-Alexandrium_andersonii.AAC.1